MYACMYVIVRTYACVSAPPHTLKHETHAHTHTRTHARARTHTHTHTLTVHAQIEIIRHIDNDNVARYKAARQIHNAHF